MVFKYYRLIVKILEENGFDSLAEDFSVPEYEYRSTGVMISNDSRFPRTMLSDYQWLIKRPGFQVNGYYFNRVESELGIDEMRFI